MEYSELIWIYFDEEESRSRHHTSLSTLYVELVDENLSTIIQMVGKDRKHTYIIAEEKRYDKARDMLNKNKQKIKEKILQPTRLDYIMGNKESILKEVTDKFKEKVLPMHTEKELDDKENILKEISNKIKEKNPQVLIGYTTENKQKYEEIVGNKL